MSKRIPLPLLVPPATEPGPDLISCTECGKCCTYVGVGINAPTRPRYATDVLWYLYHDRVSVYVDGDGEWSVQFETRCRNLGDGLLCQIYPHRPHICRAFDNETCEVNSQEGEAHTFRTPPEFLAWLAEHRPRVYRLLQKTLVPPELRTEVPPKARASVSPLPEAGETPAESRDEP